MEKVVWLEREFSLDEIRVALDSLEGDKSPSPDDFTFSFFKSCWETVGPDFVRVFREFHKDGIINRRLSSFITLMP